MPIAVTGIDISPKTSTAEAWEDGERKINVTIEPSNATNKNVTFETEDVEGLTVSSGGLLKWTADTPPGEYETTVTTEDGGFTATHRLTLEDPEVGD